MCEWLSCGEWCDVQLVCGGRAFGAHRAVLASVSGFLRRLLLSSSIEETPTAIVLPEFDLDAMASVLYYIYNGEVVIQEQKLEMFLEIVKAMQIFIDQSYLSKLMSIVNANIDFNVSYECLPKYNEVYKLGLESGAPYVNVKKGQPIHKAELHSDLTRCDMQDDYRNWSEQNPCLENMQFPCGDRQRNSFLRDLFIETYPRNGNGNGLAEGVLAISSERYHAPTSLLSANANVKHLRVDNSLLDMTERKTGHLSAKLREYTHTYHTPYPYTNSKETDERCFDKAGYSSLQTNLKSLHEDECWAREKYDVILSRPELLRNTLHERSLLNSTVDLSSSSTHIPRYEEGTTNVCEDKLLLLRNMNIHKTYSNVNVKHQSSVSRVTVLNQVLENPWSPRVPSNYRPFRRKDQRQAKQGDDVNIHEKSSVNDSNNNIEPNKCPPVSSIIPISEIRIAANDIPVKEDHYKCSVCSQVFTSSDTLGVHMKRHTSGRYTCVECNKTFSQLRNYKYHMSVHRGTREFAATCSVCGKYFNDRGYLSSHMKIHRNRKEYKCAMCPKSFNQRVAYNMHVRIHTGVKPHVCEECGKAFSRKMLLKQHQRTHSGERPYACPHCDKRFADRSNMTLHLRLHTGVKPFSCTLCPKSFTKKHHLKSHLNFHTGSKPYSCPRCKLAFTQSSNMRTHMKKCTAPEPQVNVSDSC